MILACLGFIYAILLTVIYQMQSFINEKNGLVIFKRCELIFFLNNEHDDDDGDYTEMGRNRVHVWDHWRLDSSLCGMVL